MHNLQKLLMEWRKTAVTPNVSAETLDELETHLREKVDQLVGSGMTVSDAFPRAVEELGAIVRVADIRRAAGQDRRAVQAEREGAQAARGQREREATQVLEGISFR